VELASPTTPWLKTMNPATARNAATTEDWLTMLTESQRRRALTHLDIPWDVNLYDPRDPRGLIHPHTALLGVAVAAFALGRRTFRGAEGVAEDLGRAARRALKLKRPPSDTTLYRLVSQQSPEGFRQTVQTQVEEWLQDGVVNRELFRLGVASFDGKGSWSSTTCHPEGAKKSSCDAEGTALSLLGSLRAVLTSSSARPCLDVELIADKEAESPTFRKMFPRVCADFGAHFEVVTGDAGLTARENAALVRAHHKHYLFWLKENQPTLWGIADSARASKVRCRTETRRNGNTVVRELYVLDVGGCPLVDMHDAAQVWCIRQTTVRDSGEPSVEIRHFITSMPADFLSDEERLALVRLHWGIENGHNWTMDVVLGEDNAKPCQASKDAIEVVLWLRVLAYNLLSQWRSSLGLKDKRPQPWSRAIELLRDVFVQLATLPRSVATLA
jgi:predicted transposase YbfD/YdcC